MGWKWRDAVGGAVDGFMSYGPYGAIAGGAIGGWSKDLDKGLTGNSGSGLTQNLMSMGNGMYGGGSGMNGDLPRGADISFLGQGGFDGINSGGISSDQIGGVFSQFLKQRNPADTTSPDYNPMEHAGMIRSRYPFIPDQTFQAWLRNQSPMQSYQFAGR